MLEKFILRPMREDIAQITVSPRGLMDKAVKELFKSLLILPKLVLSHNNVQCEPTMISSLG